MSGLSPEAKGIIEAARGGDEPTPRDRKRVRTSLLVRLGAGVAAGSAATSAGSGAAAAGAGKAIGMGTLVSFVPKGIAVLSAVGFIGLGAYAVQQDPSPAPPSPAVAPASAVSARAPVPAAPVASSPDHESEPVDKNEEPEEPDRPRPSAMRIDKEPVDAAPGLAEEVDCLRNAHHALREGRADEAMEVLERDSQAPSSALAQERAAMRVFALCRMGKVEQARQEAEAFLARWPHSPHATRVASSCAP